MKEEKEVGDGMGLRHKLAVVVPRSLGPRVGSGKFERQCFSHAVSDLYALKYKASTPTIRHRFRISCHLKI
jgi:hypothetical protein